MNRNGHDDAARGPGGAMTRPLLWSGAAHLLAVSACLVLGAGGGRQMRPLPVVEILLVGGESVPGGTETAGPAPAGPPSRAPALLPRPRGDAAPSPRAEDRPWEAAPAPPGPAAPAAREPRPADSDIRPAAPPASVPADAIAHGGAAPGPAVEAALVLKGLHPVATGSFAGPAAAGAPSGPAHVTAGGGAGPGATGGGDDRARPGGETGLLRERIQSRIVYPDEAVRRGLEGEVLLRIHIEKGGVPNEIRVARSSGTRLLDDAARRGVVRAAPLPSSPGWVEIPVRFRLQ